jgi:protein-L-isoaspartate(D-aspartate) O-methyltransferase
LSLPDLELSVVRRLLAEELRFTAPIVRNPAIIRAFGSVPRERFLGPGPWRVRGTAAGPAGDDFATPDADPRHVYHDVVVSIAPGRRLNNGGPGLWARCFDRLDIRPGERILHVGAGTDTTVRFSPNSSAGAARSMRSRSMELWPSALEQGLRATPRSK